MSNPHRETERTEKVIAYCAGFLDGEGCVDIQKRNRQKHSCNPEYHLRVMVVQKAPHLEPLMLLRSLWGGVIELSKKPDIYRWVLSRKQASEMLKEIMPFLLVKREQAVLGIRFQEEEVAKHNRGRRMTAAQLHTRDAYVAALRGLKHSETPVAEIPQKKRVPQLRLAI